MRALQFTAFANARLQILYPRVKPGLLSTGSTNVERANLATPPLICDKAKSDLHIQTNLMHSAILYTELKTKLRTQVQRIQKNSLTPKLLLESKKEDEGKRCRSGNFELVRLAVLPVSVCSYSIRYVDMHVILVGLLQCSYGGRKISVRERT